MMMKKKYNGNHNNKGAHVYIYKGKVSDKKEQIAPRKWSRASEPPLERLIHFRRSILSPSVMYLVVVLLLPLVLQYNAAVN